MATHSTSTGSSSSRSSSRAVVIGSGFGGLSAAIRLQSAGIQTTVLEKRDLPGGRAYVFHDKGFTLDAGPTVITAPECLEELYALSGRKLSDYVELLPVKPFYRLAWGDGYHFDYTQDLQETLDQIEKNLRRTSPGTSASSNTPKKCFTPGTPTWSTFRSCISVR